MQPVLMHTPELVVQAWKVLPAVVAVTATCFDSLTAYCLCLKYYALALVKNLEHRTLN